MRRVVIVGGGIAGLVTAYRLKQWGRGAIQYRLLESSSRLGGKITSTRQDDFLIEGGPDSFHAHKPAALDLCRELELKDEILGLKSPSGKVMIWSKGRLRPMPLSSSSGLIVPLLQSSLISWLGKLRMGVEFFIPPGSKNCDETLAAFVQRRLGREALHKIADPLLAGIHAGDPEQLSLKSTFPRFQELESEYGSLLRALWMRSKGRRPELPASLPHSPLVTLRGGLQQMIDALAARLSPEAVSVNRRVLTLRLTLDGYEIFLEGESSIRADGIVFAAPAYVTADLLENIDPALASKLREIRYVSTATVSLGFRRSDVPGSLEGSGYLVPHCEGRRVLGCTWSSNKFDGRAPDGSFLARVFVGGARAEHLADQDDEHLLELARQELRATMGIQAAPILEKVYRWQKANPQYEIGHQARVAEIAQLLSQHHGLYLAGAGYRGIGIPDCIQSGNEAARAVLEEIADRNMPESNPSSRKFYEYHC